MLQLLICPQYGDYQFNWQKLYGPVYRLKGCFGQDHLMVSDPGALQYLINSPHFVHAPGPENVVNLLFGEKSVLGVKGEEHRRLRAALNTGFTAAAVRSYQPVFEKAAKMITETLEKSTAASTDISPLLGMATLSAASEAVIGYSTADLGDEYVKNNTQVLAVSASSGSATQIMADAIMPYLPKWLLGAMISLPTPAFKILRQAKLHANRVGTQIVRDKMNAARQGLELNSDVFSLLLQDTRGKSLSEEEVVAQTAIVLIVGQDTTANTLAFGLLELAKDQHFQDTFRAEIHSNVGTGTKIAYDNMPLLNSFFKETLRLYPREPLSDRIAVQDTVIPLAESTITATGERVTEIPVRKGQLVTQAIASYLRLESRWGEDAHEFMPSRWPEVTVYRGEAIGPYANLLSFLGGPRTCLGQVAFCVILCEVVGDFSFALPENNPVRVRVSNTLLPAVSTGEKGVPLCITRVL